MPEPIELNNAFDSVSIQTPAGLHLISLGDDGQLVVKKADIVSQASPKLPDYGVNIGDVFGVDHTLPDGLGRL